jgi:site-specific recombinase XerD
MGEKPRKEYKEISMDLSAMENSAIDVIKKLQTFSFEAFRLEFLGEPDSSMNIFNSFKNYACELRSEGRIGSAITYECALHSLEDFHKKSVLRYDEITPKLLYRYESWMIGKGNSSTTVGIYLRSLRRLFNLAMKKMLVKRENYPFGSEQVQYRIPEPRNVKKALVLKDIKEIFNYSPEENSPESLYRDVWVFSYLCNGININDICLLKYRDLLEDTIQFQRAKTVRTNRNPKPIVAVRTDIVNAIIDRWGNKPKLNDSYIFPFLQEGLIPEQEKARVQQVVKQTNKYIGRIAEKVGIKATVTSYSARHSFATILKRSGVTISYISEALGHNNVSTTESYLGSFETDEIRKIAANLVNWNKE